MTDTPTDTSTEPTADGWSDDTPDEKEVVSTDTPTADTEPEDEQHDEGGGRAGREARYRARARDAESALAVAHARLEGFRTAEAERYAAAHLADTSDLWALGTVLADVLDDDGEVDEVKTVAAAEGIASRRPGLRPARVDLGQGRRGDRSPGATSWSSVLKGA